MWYKKIFFLLIWSLELINPYHKLLHNCHASSWRPHHPDFEIFDGSRLTQPLILYITNGFISDHSWIMTRTRQYKKACINLVKSRSREIGSYNDNIAMKLTGISASLLPSCMLYFRTIGKVYTRISQLRDFTRFCSEERPRYDPDITWRNKLRCRTQMVYNWLAWHGQ